METILNDFSWNLILSQTISLLFVIAIVVLIFKLYKKVK
jgi:hypothetical protein